MLTMLSCFLSLAQAERITGRVFDADGEAALFANVLLLRSGDSVMVKGVTTDGEGGFSLKGIEKGNYFIKISLLGFHDYFRPLKVEGPLPLALGNIELETQNEELEGVQVAGRKMLYQQKSDRLVINVGSLPTFSGNNALQVLQKAPGVIVQENSNSISLNNKGEVLMMINDRISRVPQGALIQQLKGMRAENIDRIELIHQPSAKYDANNAAGIIHIVLKENLKYGINGNASLTSGIGQKEKLNGSLDLNFRNDRLNVYGTATGFQSRSPMWLVNHFREYEYEDDNYFYENKFKFTNPNDNSLGFTIGADYEIDKNNIVGTLFGYTKSNMLGHDYTSRSMGTINGITDSQSQYLVDIDNPNSNTFLNLNYFAKLSEKSSINIDLDRVGLDAQNFSGLEYLDPNAEFEETETNRKSQFEIYTVKGDFESTSENGTKLETGLKGTFNNSNTVSQIWNREEGNWISDESFQMNDNIGERILAAYASIQKKWDEKWDSNLGLRLEDYIYELDEVNGVNDFEITYTNLFPVVRTSFSVDSTQTLTLSFNRRIERPGFFHLAGFNLLLDPSLLVRSNTRIRPSFTNAVRLAYNHDNFLVSLEINRVKGAISFYNTVDKERGLQTSTPINFDQMDGVLLNMGFPLKISKIWKMNWNLDGAYKKVKDASNRPSPFEKGLFTITAQLTNVFELGNSWTANLDGRYMSPYIAGDQVLYLHHYINFGITKKFMNQSSLTFSVQDITATSGIIEWEYDQPELGIKTFGDNNWSERVFQLTYSFPFGNQKVKEKRNRVTGSKEERDRM